MALGSLLAGAGAGAAVTIVIQAIDKTSGVLGKINTNMLALGAGITAVGIGGAVMFTGLVKGASDLEESIQKLDVIFDQIAPDELASKVDILTNSFGLSDRSAVTFLGNTGDILTGLGFADKAALDMSVSVSTLAVDLASFTNIEGGAARVTDILNKALVGEREGLKSLGVVVTEEMVKEQLLASGKENLTGTSLTQAKAEAVLQLVLGQSSNALGDYERTQGSFANQSRLLTERLTDLKDSLGKELLPLFTKLVGILVKVVNWFNKLNPTVRKWIVIGAAVATGLALIIGPILMIIALLPALIAGVGTLSAVSLPLTILPLLIAAAIVALIAAGVLLVKHWDKVKIAVKNLGILIGNVFKGIANAVLMVWNFIVNTIESRINFVIKLINGLIKGLNKIPGINIRTIGKVSLDKFKADLFELSDFVGSPSKTTNVNINNVNGFNGKDIARELEGELTNTIRL